MTTTGAFDNPPSLIEWLEHERAFVSKQLSECDDTDLTPGPWTIRLMWQDRLAQIEEELAEAQQEQP